MVYRVSQFIASKDLETRHNHECTELVGQVCIIGGTGPRESKVTSRETDFHTSSWYWPYYYGIGVYFPAEQYFIATLFTTRLASKLERNNPIQTISRSHHVPPNSFLDSSNNEERLRN